jgi:hypothetical protein
MPQNVTNIYGVRDSSYTWQRIDHCLFDQTQYTFAASELVGDYSWCLKRCEEESNEETQCGGVNIFPAVTPKSAYQEFTAPPNTTWYYPNLYGADVYGNWNTTTKALSDALLSDASPEKYICTAIIPKLATDTSDIYTVTRDPENPIFYSTCMYRYVGNWFPGYGEVPKVTMGPWRFGDKCLDCKSRVESAVSGAVPKWKIADKCVDCDYEPEGITPPKEAIEVEPQVRCDGLGSSWSKTTHYEASCGVTCVPQLTPDGRDKSAGVTLAECGVLVEQNTNCSSRYIYTTAGMCYCYHKDPCCITCSRRKDTNANVYETVTKPDPTCATGVLSADGKSCCSAKCGVDKCIANNANLNQPGFCCSTCITRSCSQYGPPCMV